MLSPRSIAMQGLGFAALAIAVQGFTPTTPPVVPPPPTQEVGAGITGRGHRQHVRPKAEEKKAAVDFTAQNDLIRRVAERFLEVAG